MSTETTIEADADRDFDHIEARLERHTLMANLATRFISIPAGEIPAAVDDAMAAIGRFAGVDRVSLALFDRKRERWTIDHDWHSDGLWSLKGLVEHVAPFRWGLSRIMDGAPLDLMRTDELPRSAANEVLLMRGLGLGAALLIPIERAGQVIGFATIASTTPRRTPWPKAFHELLALPGRMMVHALERGVTEQRLRDSQSRWTSLCNSNVVGVFTTRRSDGTIVECNEAGLRLLGRTREELTAQSINWFNTTPPEERDTDVRMLGILDRLGRVMPWEKRVWRPDDSRVPVLVSLASLAPQSDDMLSVTIDLSSRRRVTEELRRRDDIDQLHASLSRRLLDLAGEDIEEAVREALGDVARKFGFDGVVIFDIDADASVALRRSWWRRPEAMPVEPEARISLADRAWWRERLRAGRTTFLAGVRDLPESAHAERQALRRFRLEACLSVPLLPGGTLRGLILFYSGAPVEVAEDLLATLRVFGDIVANALERKRIDHEIRDALATLERRVELRRSQLEASNAELEAFAYSVSHDLRAPLRTIDGMCTVLREDWAKELGTDGVLLLLRIQAATQRMGHLIAGLLQLSRVVRTEMEWDEVSISDLAESVVDDLKRRIGARSVEVQLMPGIHVVGHARLLRIAFEQILDNAFKFTGVRADAVVELTAEIDDEKTVIRVRDNGVGFEPEFARKLFGAFQRLHAVEDFEGHGIGLATVGRVVRMHGGTASAQGKPNEGATISLTFPHAARPA